MERTRLMWQAGSVSLDWSTVYSEHAPALVRFLTKLTGDQEVASELLQETFVRAIRSGESASQPRSIRPWLFRVAGILARDHQRRRSLLRFVPFSGREADQSSIHDPEVELLHRALRGLPAAQSRTLLLHYDAGFSRREIAEMEGISEDGVKSRLSRGRDAFLQAYERVGGEAGDGQRRRRVPARRAGRAPLGSCRTRRGGPTLLAGEAALERRTPRFIVVAAAVGVVVLALVAGNALAARRSSVAGPDQPSTPAASVEPAAAAGPSATPRSIGLQPDFGFIYSGVRPGYGKGSAPVVRREGELSVVAELAPSFFNGFTGAISPDGRLSAYFAQPQNKPWTLYLLDGARPNEQRELLTIPDDIPGGRPVWSPDGKGVAFVVLNKEANQGVKPLYSAIRTIDLASGAVTERARIEGGSHYEFVGWDRARSTLAATVAPDREAANTYVVITQPAGALGALTDRTGRSSPPPTRPRSSASAAMAPRAPAVPCGCGRWTTSMRAPIRSSGWD